VAYFTYPSKWGAGCVVLQEQNMIKASVPARPGWQWHHTSSWTTTTQKQNTVKLATTVPGIVTIQILDEPVLAGFCTQVNLCK